MKQSLQLKTSQQLTMTPQLQQAIRLLQLSSLDLQQEIQDTLDSNMLLEVDDHEHEHDSNDDNSYTDPTTQLKSDTSELTAQIDKTIQQSSENDNASDSNQKDNNDLGTVDFEDNQNTIPTEMPIDTDWDEIFDSNAIHTTNNAPNYNGADSDIFENASKQGESIQEHLRWQLELSTLSVQDKEIGEVIIDSINDNGFLSSEFDELLENFTDNIDVEKEEIIAVLRYIQHFDPPGVAARDLQESLLIQLNILSADTPYRDEAITVIERHMLLLANRDFTTLKRRAKLSDEELKHIINLIRSLNPRPAGQITEQNIHYIVPDVIVKKVNNIWHAELNQESMPPLTINKQYMDMIKQIKNEKDSSTLKDHLQEARWFIKSIQSRNETLLKVARCILDFQQDFFNYGDEYMKALVLADVAEVVGMHESTISRVTTQKYMHTPKGVFELKYFFSSHISTTSGGEASATAIRAIIKKIIESEESSKPFSDNKLSQILKEQNYQVARRTVAKYRESMSIPPSNERKSFV